MTAGALDGFRVAGVSVTRDANARIIGEHARDALSHFRAAVGHHHLPGML
jgi:hypothetical protein